MNFGEGILGTDNSFTNENYKFDQKSKNCD